MRRRRFPGQNGHDVLPIDDPILWEGDTRELQAGWEKVEIHTHLGRVRARRDDAAPRGNEWHAKATLKRQELSAPGIARVALPPGAVVTGEDSQCLACQS